MNVENTAIIDDTHKKKSNPKDWELVPIAQIISNIKGGVSVNGEDVAASNGEPAVLKLSAISYGRFAPYENKVIHNHELNRLGPSVRKGNILISRSNTSELVGACVHVDRDYPNLFLPDLIWEIEVSADNDARWLTYVLSSGIVRNRLVAYANGTSGSMKKISMTSLRSLKVHRPSLKKQKSIVQFLSTWDTAITQTERLIAAKQKRFLWLAKSLVDPKDDGHEWHEEKLEDVAGVVKGQQLNVSDMIQGGKYYVLNGGVGPSGYSDKWNTDENTITISEGGNSCGFVNFNKEKFWCGGHCYALCNVKDGVDDYYLYYFLKRHEESLMRLRVGSGLPNIQRKDITNFRVLLPALGRQKKISFGLNAAHQEILLLRSMVDQFKKQKRGLMQKLLTGKVRVKV